MQNNSGTGWKARARQLKREIHAVALACKDPRVPWYAKALAACIVGYAFSPIDLIPDPIPVLGYLDDLVLLPLAILLLLKLIPDEVLAECREKARRAEAEKHPANWVAAGVIVLIWILLAAMAVAWVLRWLRH